MCMHNMNIATTRMWLPLLACQDRAESVSKTCEQRVEMVREQSQQLMEQTRIQAGAWKVAKRWATRCYL